MPRSGFASRRTLVFGLILTALAIGLVVAASTGSVRIRFDEVVNAVFAPDTVDVTTMRILLRIRFPRVLAAMGGGAALAVAGQLLQVLFNNPIADPYVLGISSGARLFVGLSILGGVTFGFNHASPWLLFTAATIGSLINMSLVLAFASRLRSVTTLLLVGIMLGYLSSAMVGALIVFSDDTEIADFTKWALGSFGSLGWEKTATLLIVGLSFVVLACLLAKPLNVMLMGQSYAQTMGINVLAVRVAVVLIAGVLTAVVTAFAGLISFIGLSVPHLARLVQRTADNRILLPTCALLGALLAICCDLIARTVVAPSELSLGTVTSFIGVPLVMYLLLKRRALP